MLSGSRTISLRGRSVIQVSSCHWWCSATTTDAVAGGRSVPRAIGSALARQTPSGPQMSNLYRVFSPTSGMNSSQMPEPPSDRIGCPWPFQWLKSPMTRTPRALGAPPRERGAGHVPRAGGAEVAIGGAGPPPQFLVPALTDQVQVELAQG